MRRSLPAAALLALCAASPANAYLKAGPAGYGHWLQGAIAPLDGGGTFAAPSEAYSFRKLKSTYAGPAIKLRRTTGGTQDIGFLGFTGFTGAPIDTAAAAAFCAATTCFLDTWYDQSGNNRHVTQATAANQPQYIANCSGGLPCARSAGAAGSQNMTATGLSSATGNGSFSAVARRQAGTDYCYAIQAYYGTGTQSVLAIQTGTDQWYVGGNSVNLFGAAVASAFHAVVGVVGAGATLRIDATETAGAVTGVANSGTLYLAMQNPNVTCDYSELVHWDGYLMPQAERAALTANQKSFWSLP